MSCPIASSSTIALPISHNRCSQECLQLPDCDPGHLLHFRHPCRCLSKVQSSRLSHFGKIVIFIRAESPRRPSCIAARKYCQPYSFSRAGICPSHIKGLFMARKDDIPDRAQQGELQAACVSSNSTPVEPQSDFLQGPLLHTGRQQSTRAATRSGPATDGQRRPASRWLPLHLEMDVPAVCHMCLA